jgi:soluble lytic murein transglycosylase-like protein
MLRASQIRFGAILGFCAFMAPAARAAEHVTLKNGFEMDCSRREVVGDRVRLYMPANGTAGSVSYIEVAPDAVARVETVPDPPPVELASVPLVAKSAPMAALTTAEMKQMLAHAGTEHNIDEDLLASVVRAESGGQVRAVSHAGAQGLMQLMPGTANELGVKDAFQPEENISGGTAYLDELLTRYRDNVALALAAYNAGPAAVDRYHGVPPYRETRMYVARVIREFNRRKQAGAAAQVARAK